MSVDFAMAACAVFLSGGFGKGVVAEVSFVRTEKSEVVFASHEKGSLEAIRSALRMRLPGSSPFLGAGASFLVRFDKKTRFDLNEASRFYTRSATVGALDKVWAAYIAAHGGANGQVRRPSDGVEETDCGDGLTLRVVRTKESLVVEAHDKRYQRVDRLTFGPSHPGPVPAKRFELGKGWVEVK